MSRSAIWRASPNCTGATTCTRAPASMGTGRTTERGATGDMVAGARADGHPRLVLLIVLVLVVNQAQVDHGPFEKTCHERAPPGPQRTAWAQGPGDVSGPGPSPVARPPSLVRPPSAPGRGPNNACPRRTMVAPSSRATSRSWLIPIDNSA